MAETAAKSSVRPIPEGYRTATPSLTVQDADGAIAFYTRAFGAQELSRALGPDGKQIWHATIKIGDSIIMLNDEFPEMNCLSPKSLGGTPSQIFLYVEDADAVWDQAVKAGATVAMDLMDAFWGDRCGTITDPYGHQWSIATHKEDLAYEEIMRRLAEMTPPA
jgi:uncharacterized glyoxalase superfamily protein PhnB